VTVRAAVLALTCAVLGALAPVSVHAQADRPRAEVLPALSAIDWSRRPVLLLTMGQGDAVFEKFGHNAIALWDEVAGAPLVYNWGMFDFDQPNFLGRFLTGDTKYWMAPATIEETVAQYVYLNRTMVAQELALSPAQQRRLAEMLRENAREANKFYRYDYYLDNCSTRVRDALNAVTGGAIERQLRPLPGDGSYRWHTRRLLAYSMPMYFGAQLVLGVRADAPLTRWEEAFLPQSLAASMRRIELPSGDGLPARLAVVRQDTLLLSARELEPTSVKGGMLLRAILLGAVLAGLCWLIGTFFGRVGTGAAVLTWSLVSVLLGTVLLLAWFATRHTFMRDNPSVALFNPAWLIGIVLAWLVWRARVSRRAAGALRILLLVAVVGAAGAAMAGATSALEMAALILPTHAVCAALVRNARGMVA
jgi:hypothetical protein